MDQQPQPLLSLTYREKLRSISMGQQQLLKQSLVKERQQASKAAPSPTVPSDSYSTQQASKIAPGPTALPNSYSTRLETFTSWPHSNPSASVMAMAGFHQVHVKRFNDMVECSECHISLARWNGDDNPLLEHEGLTSHYCPFIMTKSKPPVKGSAPPKHSETPTTSYKPPPTSTAATTTAPEMPPSTKKKSPYAGYYHVSPGRRDVTGKLLDKKPKDAPGITDVLPSSVEEVAMDSEDWVDLGYEGEEKDGWIEV